MKLKDLRTILNNADPSHDEDTVCVPIESDGGLVGPSPMDEVVAAGFGFD